MNKKTKTPGGRAGEKFCVVSMTGFGRAVLRQGKVSVEVETKSVNSRYLDCSIKLPKEYSPFEAELRELVAARLQRGRVEVFVTRSSTGADASGLHFDQALFDAYVKVYRSAYKSLGIKTPNGEVMANHILARWEVLETGDGPEESAVEKDVLWSAVAKALDELNEMRAREGARLGRDMLERIERLRVIRVMIEKGAADAPAELMKRLQERMNKLLSSASVDESRICAEAALLAEKVDVSEELVRLESHFKQFELTMEKSPNGRKLDFLLQEIGREFNTISSKAQDAALQNAVVDAKTEIEKIREQVQNIE